MKINNCEFTVEIRNKKPVVCLYYNGKLDDVMTIYSIKNEPYVKRMSNKIYLTDELLGQLKTLTA